MILFLSGNFAQLSDIKKEKAMAVRLKEQGYDYHRLLTFYYLDNCNTILTVAKEIKENIYESKPSGTTRHLIKTNTGSV